MGVDLFPPASVPDPFIGRTLNGRYEMLARLGVGGVGVVYQGRQVELDRPVAIKVLQQSAAASPEWRRRFEREARALSALRHPNVVPLTDFGVDGDVPYLVMELLEGKTLADLINEESVSATRALGVVRQTLRGLAFAHDKGIAHRDLKPANIFLQALPDQTDQVRLLDFGTAKFLEGVNAPGAAENPSRVGAVFGTPSYMAPEQAKAERVDTRADIYAAGAILFELLAGRPPYVADTPQAVMEAHVFEPVPSLAEARPDLSIAPLVQPVIDRAMAKKPADRYPKALWMLSALEAIDGGSHVAAPSGVLAPTPTLKNLPPVRNVRRAPAPREPPTLKDIEPVSGVPRSRPWRTAIALVVVAAAVATGATFLRRHRGSLVENAEPVAAQAPAPDPQTTPTPPAHAPAQPPSPTTAAPTQTPTKPASAGTPGQRARDPWQEPVPEALKPLREKLEHGARLNEGALGPAYAFARQNPTDPRGWLLIAHAYAQLGWMSDSVERYQRAYRADPTGRGDPQMLEDLLKAATHRVAGRNAARAIRDIYGAEALPALEKAIARGAGDRDGNDSLDHLRDSLAQ
ncbi:MAG TPA: protein kinase [Polyangia bacterium]|nr:protein kinase [Polyangia bacterium]